jgi:hypothetical protein
VEDKLKERSLKGKGKINAISISKTKKITARRKNRRENGIRADLLGSNPHSKGEDFSRSLSDREDKIQDIKNTSRGRRILIDEKVSAKDMKP